jgi:hypothetical protein
MGRWQFNVRETMRLRSVSEKLARNDQTAEAPR